MPNRPEPHGEPTKKRSEVPDLTVQMSFQPKAKTNLSDLRIEHLLNGSSSLSWVEPPDICGAKMMSPLGSCPNCTHMRKPTDCCCSKPLCFGITDNWNTVLHLFLMAPGHHSFWRAQKQTSEDLDPCPGRPFMVWSFDYSYSQLPHV